MAKVPDLFKPLKKTGKKAKKTTAKKAVSKKAAVEEPKKRRGRPPGKKVKKTTAKEKKRKPGRPKKDTTKAEIKAAPKRRGRPPGSKNKNGTTKYNKKNGNGPYTLTADLLNPSEIAVLRAFGGKGPTTPHKVPVIADKYFDGDTRLVRNALRRPKLAGALANVERGLYQITDVGRALLKSVK